MPRERIINGKKNCRCYIARNLWISSDGTVAGMSDKKGHVKPLTIKEDVRGKYVIHDWYGRVSVAKAVMTCWCPRCPEDGKNYVIGYKDGNKSNCDKSNLLWEEYHYKHSTANEETLNLYGTDYVVSKDGTIKKEKTTEVIGDCQFDGDMGLFAVLDPFIGVKKPGTIHQEKISVDTIMKLCGFVQGDDAGMKDPKILHRDLDWKNFASDNLEWIEADDQKFIEYLDQRKKDMRKRSEELNNGKDLPDYWI